MQNDIFSILRNSGVTIGSWNELKSLTPERDVVVDFVPPSNAIDLYVAARCIAKWINPNDLFVLQLDNSTAPSSDEVEVFKTLSGVVGGEFDLDICRTFCFQRTVEVPYVETLLELMIFHAIIFSWHVHFVADSSINGRRLSIQDGCVYFFCDELSVMQVSNLIDELKENSLNL